MRALREQGEHLDARCASVPLQRRTLWTRCPRPSLLPRGPVGMPRTGSCLPPCVSERDPYTVPGLGHQMRRGRSQSVSGCRESGSERMRREYSGRPFQSRQCRRSGTPALFARAVVCGCISRGTANGASLPQSCTGAASRRVRICHLRRGTYTRTPTAPISGIANVDLQRDLNTRQLQAATHPDDPLLVVAGGASFGKEAAWTS